MVGLYYRDITGCYIRHDEFIKDRPGGSYISQFTHKNLKKQNMIRLGNLYSAKKLPDTIKHYTILDNGKDSSLPEGLVKSGGIYVKVPAGISSYLTSSFTSSYDSEVIEHPNLSRRSYDYQQRVILQMDIRNIGLLHASTGSGKTQMICDIIVRKKRKTLVMVQNLTQMSQMVDDITSILGKIPKQISGKKSSKKQIDSWYPYITVCSIDSRDKIDPKDYGLILLDEADTYLGSDDRREWVGSLSPEYMYALTGTIKINHVDDNVFRLYYGYKTELKLHHHTPEYKQVHTQFEYYLDDMKEFHELKAALYGSEERNKLIINTTMNYIGGRKGVVFTEHVEHAKYLAKEFEQRGIKTFLLIGEVKDDDRERIRQEAKEYKGEVLIVGSVKIIGRGFDLPELSLGILTTCEKFESNINQYVGRIIRECQGKPKPIFIDMVDILTPILYRQSQTRLRNFNKAFKG